MLLPVNIRHLERKPVELKGELSPAELGLTDLDELVHVDQPLMYDLQADLIDQSILVQGRISLELQCECARCLKRYTHELVFENWACHLPLEGEDKVELISDSVDLTPYIREDIVLGFPQHPLCEADCAGLSSGDLSKPRVVEPPKVANAQSTWSELNKLKFD